MSYRIIQMKIIRVINSATSFCGKIYLHNFLTLAIYLPFLKKRYKKTPTVNLVISTRNICTACDLIQILMNSLICLIEFFYGRITSPFLSKWWIMRAGLPAITTSSPNDLVTTEPAPTTIRLPSVTPGKIVT